MNPFRSLQNDTVFIEKSDGTRIGPFKTAVARDSATIFDGSIDVVEGDTLIRPLPSGREESFVIVSADFSQGLHSIPAHYSLKLRKTTAISEKPSTKQTTIHINNSTGIQVGDNNVLNIQNALNELIQKIESSDGSAQEKAQAKSRLSEFLSHPLVTSILGGVAGSLSGLLGGG